MRHIVVTGTSGYLGAAIAKHLRATGFVVSEVKSQNNFLSDLTIALKAGAEIVVHAGFRVSFIDSRWAQPSGNFATTQDLIEACKKFSVQRVVMIGAAGLWGVRNSQDPLSELNPPCADFRAYSETQYIREKRATVQSILREFSEAAVLHPTTVYGEGMQFHVTRGLRGRVHFIPPGGTSGVSLSDFLRALDLVLNTGARGEWIVNGANFSYRELFRWANPGGVWLIPIPTFFAPIIGWLAKTRWGSQRNFAVIESAFGYKYYSSKKIAAELGWSPRSNIAVAVYEALSPKN